MQVDPTGRVPKAPKRRRGSRSLLRATLVALGAMLAFALATSVASAAPSVTLEHDWDLETNPTVGVEGAGFLPPTPPPVGLYTAQIAIDGDSVIVGSSQRYIRPAALGGVGPTLLNSNGTFSSDIDVVRELGTDPDSVDCAEVQCYVGTWLAHTNPTPDSFYTLSPLYFEPTIVAEPTSGIAATGDTITISGGGFDPAMNGGNGFYVSQGAVIEGAVKYGPTRVIHPSPSSAYAVLNADGTFSTQLEIASTFETSAFPPGSPTEVVNCGLVQCRILAWPAKSIPDAGEPGNLIANIPLSFAYSPEVTVNPTSGLKDQDVAVTGQGFPPGFPGHYVSQAAIVDGQVVTPPAGPAGGTSATRYIRPNALDVNDRLNPDGSFNTVLGVTRKFTTSAGAEIDCAVATCVIATWRGHTDPTVATLYTSTSLTFQKDAPPPPPPVVDDPVKPKLNAGKKKRLRVGRKARALRVLAIRCGSEDCRIAKPKRTVLRVGKKKFGLRVVGPAKVGKGKRAIVKLRVPGRVAKALVGRKGRVAFRVVVRSDSGNDVVRVNKVLIGARKAKR